MFSSVGMGILHRHNMSLWKILLLSLDFVFVTSKKKDGWTGLNMRWILTKSGRKGNNNFNWTPQQNPYNQDLPQDFIKALCLFQSLKSPKTWNVTISLISHAAKIVLKVIKKRITPLIEKKSVRINLVLEKANTGHAGNGVRSHPHALAHAFHCSEVRFYLISIWRGIRRIF